MGEQTSQSQPTPPGRLMLAAALVAGLCTMFAAFTDLANPVAVVLPASLVAAAFVTWGTRFGVTVWVPVVFIASAVVAALSLLDLVAVLTDLENLQRYGGAWGLILRLVGAGAGVTLLILTLREARDAEMIGRRNPLQRPEIVAAIGGIVVVGAWILMLISAWILTRGQAFGVAAAVVAVAVALLHSWGALPLSSTSRRTLIACLAALGFFVALASLVGTVGDWDFIREFGGLGMLLPYIAYLGGAVILGSAGVLAILGMRRDDGKLAAGHVAALAAVGAISVITLVVALAGGGPSVGEPPTASEDESSSDSSTDPPALPGGSEDDSTVSHDIPPLDGCQLLTLDQVEESLGVIDSPGMFITGGAEACTWQPNFEDGPDEDLFVTLAPASQNDFLPGAQKDGIDGELIADVGARAVWFGGTDRGSLAVIDSVDVDFALIEIEVSRPEVDGATRLDAAKSLANQALTVLKGETVEPVEVSLCDLVSDEAAEEILAPLRLDRPAAGDRFVVVGGSTPVDLTTSGDESCQKLMLVEIYVEVANGSIDDFGPGAQLGGVSGEPIEGIGDEAVWFADVPVDDALNPPQGAGILAVRSGEATFRVGLRLPEVDFADQLDMATGLANTALVRVLAGDDEVIVIEHVPEDDSPDDLVDNLLAKEEEGEWTRGEGLAATLRFVVGEAEAEEVLVDPELTSTEPTGIVNMTYDYLADAPDPAEAEELERLLGFLVWSDDQLAEMAGIEGPTASLGDLWLQQTPSGPTENCTKFFSGWEIPGGIGTCLEMRTSFVLEDLHPGDFRVFGPASPYPIAGWQPHHFDLAIAAMEETVPVFHGLGEMPSTNIVFSVINDPKALAVAAPRRESIEATHNRPCGITLFTNMQALSDLSFKQVVGHELAHCLHGHTFPAQYDLDRTLVDWWDEGMADYLSNIITSEYASNNFEWNNLDRFDSVELGTGVLDRKYDNFIFFQHLANFYQNVGIFNMIKLMEKASDREAMEGAMAGYGGIDAQYHSFVEMISDVAVTDTDGSDIPNAPDSRAIDITGSTHVFDEPLPFGATRLSLQVADGMFACVEETRAGGVRSSSRSGLPGQVLGPWTDGVPDVINSELVVVVSATRPDGSYTLSVTDVSDEPDCEEDEPDNEDFDCIDICDPSSYYRALDDLTAELLAYLEG